MNRPFRYSRNTTWSRRGDTEAKVKPHTSSHNFKNSRNRYDNCKKPPQTRYDKVPGCLETDHESESFSFLSQVEEEDNFKNSRNPNDNCKKPPQTRYDKVPGYLETEHESESFSFLPNVEDEDAAMTIQIAPGEDRDVLSADDSWRSIADDSFLVSTCWPCNGATVLTVPHAAYMLCPTCRTVTPVADDRSGKYDVVGLGFTVGDVESWHRQRHAWR